MLRGVVLAAVLLTLPEALRAASPPGRDAQAVLLLKENCFSCHNPDKHKGELVLTTRDSALKGNENGPAVVPGNSGDSRLIQVLSADADPHMPPKKQLAAEHVAQLRAWIDAGAAWDERLLLSAAAATRPVQFRSLPAAYRPVLAVAVSPDGRRLAAGRGNRVFIHDLTKPDRPLIATLDGVRDVVQSLAWSPNGRRLAAGDFRQAVVWDGETLATQSALVAPAGRVTALQFLSDEVVVAADSETAGPASLHLYHLPDTRPRKSVLAHADSIYSLAAPRDGSALASAAADKLVKLWDPANLTEVAQLEGHTGHVLAVAFKADGAVLASAGADKDLKLWDVKTREQKLSCGPHPAPITSIAFAPDGNGIFASCEDGTVRLDPADNSRSGRGSAPGKPFPPAADVLYSMALSPDGKTIYGGCHDGNVYVWGADGTPKGKIPPPRD